MYSYLFFFRPILFKVKGPQGKVITELPLSDNVGHSSKHSDDSSSFFTLRGPRGEFIAELPISDEKRYRPKSSKY